MNNNQLHFEENIKQFLQSQPEALLNPRLRAAMYGRLVTQLHALQNRPVFPLPVLLALAGFLALTMGLTLFSTPGSDDLMFDKNLLVLAEGVVLMNLLSLPVSCLLIVLLRRQKQTHTDETAQ